MVNLTSIKVAKGMCVIMDVGETYGEKYSELFCSSVFFFYKVLKMGIENTFKNTYQ